MNPKLVIYLGLCALIIYYIGTSGIILSPNTLMYLGILLFAIPMILPDKVFFESLDYEEGRNQRQMDRWELNDIPQIELSTYNSSDLQYAYEIYLYLGDQIDEYTDNKELTRFTIIARNIRTTVEI